jgi:site-specific recombinase XerD
MKGICVAEIENKKVRLSNEMRIFWNKKAKRGSKGSFVWVLDERKFLRLDKVRRLRRTCEKDKRLALQKGRAVPVRDCFLVELGLFSGLRVEEMAMLKCGDLVVGEGRCSIVVRKGKGGRKRTVLISKKFKEGIIWFLDWKKNIGQDASGEAPVFTNSSGRHLTTRALEKAFKRCARKAGLESHYSIHCLRHTYGTYLYKASGYNLRLVQQQLGHVSIKTTEVYANLVGVDARRAVECLYGARNFIRKGGG